MDSAVEIPLEVVDKMDVRMFKKEGNEFILYKKEKLNIQKGRFETQTLPSRLFVSREDYEKVDGIINLHLSKKLIKELKNNDLEKSKIALKEITKSLFISPDKNYKNINIILGQVIKYVDRKDVLKLMSDDIDIVSHCLNCSILAINFAMRKGLQNQDIINHGIVALLHHQNNHNGYFGQLINLIDCYEQLVSHGNKPFKALKHLKEDVANGQLNDQLFKQFVLSL